MEKGKEQREPSPPDYRDYSEFWRISLEKIDEIQGKLKTAVKQLEGKYSGFDEIYSVIVEELDTLSSIYSSYNSIDGGEYILKLNSLIKEYRRRYTRDGIDFALIEFLLKKIGELRNRSVENFPLLRHREGEKEEPVYREDDLKKEYTERPYKWITYERNGSWFISRFKDILVIDAEEAKDIVWEDKEYIAFSYGDRQYRGLDHFGNTTPDKSDVKFFIILDGGKKVYSASHVGKRLYARKDLVEKKIEPFTSPHHTPLYSGYVRVFGKRHILVA